MWTTTYTPRTNKQTKSRVWRGRDPLTAQQHNEKHKEIPAAEKQKQIPRQTDIIEKKHRKNFFTKLRVHRSNSNLSQVSGTAPLEEDETGEEILIAPDNKTPKVRVRIPATSVAVECLKDDKSLWYTRTEITNCRQMQEHHLQNNETAKLYLSSVRATHRKLTNGGQAPLKFPPELKQGLNLGLAGLECFSMGMEANRRGQAKAIVKTLVGMSKYITDPEELREHAVKLNAASLQWALSMGRAEDESAWLYQGSEEKEGEEVMM